MATHTVSVYSMVLKLWMSSAGRFCSLMSLYWGGKPLRWAQKQHTQSLARTSSWQNGLRMAPQPAREHCTLCGGCGGQVAGEGRRVEGGCVGEEGEGVGAGGAAGCVRRAWQSAPPSASADTACTSCGPPWAAAQEEAPRQPRSHPRQCPTRRFHVASKCWAFRCAWSARPRSTGGGGHAPARGRSRRAAGRSAP